MTGQTYGTQAIGSKWPQEGHAPVLQIAVMYLSGVGECVSEGLRISRVLTDRKWEGAEWEGEGWTGASGQKTRSIGNEASIRRAYRMALQRGLERTGQECPLRGIPGGEEGPLEGLQERLRHVLPVCRGLVFNQVVPESPTLTAWLRHQVATEI